MDDEEARATCFQPRSADASPPGTAIIITPGRTLRAANEPIATRLSPGPGRGGR
jgi:hypothetical protein